MGAGTSASDYDGTNDYALRGADLTGIVNGKAGTISFWVRLDGGDGSPQRVLVNSGGDFQIIRTNGDVWRLFVRNTSNTVICNVLSNSTYTSGSGWHHVIFAWDLATPEAYLFISGSDDKAAGSTETDDTIDYTSGSNDWAVGAVTAGAAKLNGCLSELWFDDTFFDISVGANLAKFISGGVPVELGGDGSTPTGVSPLIYAPDGDPSTNAGTGGNFSITGSLTACSDTPGVISETFEKTIAASAIGTASVAKVARFPKTIAAAGIGTAVLSRLKTIKKTIAASGVGTVDLIKKHFITIAAAGVGTAALVKAFVKPITIAAAAIGTAVFSVSFVKPITIAATAVGTAALSRLKTIQKTIAASAIGTASIGRVKRLAITIAATGIGTANIWIVRCYEYLLTAFSTLITKLADVTTENVYINSSILDTSTVSAPISDNDILVLADMREQIIYLKAEICT